MNRRGFLRSLLGIAAGAALPAPALKFIADNAVLEDAAFREKAIIDLINLRIAAMNKAMIEIIETDIFNSGTISPGVGLSAMFDDDD